MHLGATSRRIRDCIADDRLRVFVMEVNTTSDNGQAFGQFMVGGSKNKIRYAAGIAEQNPSP